jgi:hypothetical protein
MSAGNETHVDQSEHVDRSEHVEESEHAAAPEMADLVQWGSSSTADPAATAEGRDHRVGLAVAGITIAALLVGGLVALVISLSS